MDTPPNAARRPARDGRAHLTLVTSQGEPAQAGPADNDRQPAGRHAAPAARIVPPAGSATMRALIALGAVLTAIGFSFGRAEAVHGSHEHVEEAEPDIGPALKPVTPPAPADTTPVKPAPAKAMQAKVVTTKAASTPAQAAVTTETTAGHWEPAITPAQAYTYTLPAPTEGSGRHRRTASAEVQAEQISNDQESGRHRKGQQPSETTTAKAGGAQAGSDRDSSQQHHTGGCEHHTGGSDHHDNGWHHTGGAHRDHHTSRISSALT